MFKFNGGRGALVCDVCHTTVSDRYELPEDDPRWEVPALCDQCGLRRVSVPRALLLNAARRLLNISFEHRAPMPAEIPQLVVEATKPRVKTSEVHVAQLCGPLHGYNLDDPEGDRIVMLFGQQDPADNGPWVVMRGPWKRPS